MNNAIHTQALEWPTCFEKYSSILQYAPGGYIYDIIWLLEFAHSRFGY